MTSLPKKYAWLLDEHSPRMLVHMLEIFGTVEQPGSGNNPKILSWAQELDISKTYSRDEIPWCGLAMAVVAHRSGYEPPPSFLSALAWSKFGVGQPLGGAMLGDVLVFRRKGGGHVTLYVGEDSTHYHCMGGNQSDQVCIILKPKATVVAIRRSPFKVGQPANVRRITLSASGTPTSTKES